jgi:hypothetical protein
MNHDKQRIAIAEACGIVSKDKWGSLYKTPRGILRDCPDYPTDLNAMHEAEKVLTLPERRKYRKTLLGHCEPASIAIHATAAQRAEAFLLTIGKWEDAK